MGVQKASVDSRIREKLGEDGLQLALASMWAADCQTCNRPLRGDVPALVVDDAITFVIATLHHQRCRASTYVDDGAIHMARSATVSFTSLSLVLQATSGRADDRAALLVNPTLEMLMLKRTPLGRWQVDIGAEFLAAGLRSPANELDFGGPIPGATAQLRGGQVAVSLAGPPPQQYAAGVTPHFTTALKAHGGLALVITHALNPPELTSMAELQPVLAGDRTVAGWVTLR